MPAWRGFTISVDGCRAGIANATKVPGRLRIFDRGECMPWEPQARFVNSATNTARYLFLDYFVKQSKKDRKDHH